MTACELSPGVEPEGSPILFDDGGTGWIRRELPDGDAGGRWGGRFNSLEAATADAERGRASR